MLIMHIGHISRTPSFQQNRHINFHALVALKLLVSLISRLVACSARIVVDRQTDRQTHRPCTNYCNPRCACAPRVNNIISSTHVADASLPAHSHDVFDQLVEVPDENDEVATIHRYIPNSVQYDLFEILIDVCQSK